MDTAGEVRPRVEAEDKLPVPERSVADAVVADVPRDNGEARAPRPPNTDTTGIAVPPT